MSCKVGGHDGGGLHGAEAEVVAGRGDGEAHEVTVLVDGGDKGGHDDGEDLGLPERSPGAGLTGWRRRWYEDQLLCSRAGRGISPGEARRGRSRRQPPR